MSNNHHTAIATGANADDTVFNAPLSQLDQTLTDMLDGSEPFTALKIGNAGAMDTTALADVESTTKGLLIPRMTSGQRDAIVSPEEGLLVFNTSANVVSRYNGSAWGNYGGGTSPFVEIVPPTSFSGLPFTISGISQDYHDLILRLSGHSTGALPRVLYLRPNGTSVNYSWAQVVIPIGSAVETNLNDEVDSEIEIQSVPAVASAFDAELLIVFRNYAATGARIFGSWSGIVGNASGSRCVGRGGFEDRNLAPIESIELRASGDDIAGKYALYGMGTPE